MNEKCRWERFERFWDAVRCLYGVIRRMVLIRTKLEVFFVFFKKIREVQRAQAVFKGGKIDSPSFGSSILSKREQPPAEKFFTWRKSPGRRCGFLIRVGS